jgi:hypothetical protein
MADVDEFFLPRLDLFAQDCLGSENDVQAAVEAVAALAMDCDILPVVFIELMREPALLEFVLSGEPHRVQLEVGVF